MKKQLLSALVTAGVLSLVSGACASPSSTAASVAADSCAADPFATVSDTNQFSAGPEEVFSPDPLRPDGWLVRAKRRAQLSAQAAAEDSFWQPLADSWGIAEAAARAATQPEVGVSAAELKLSYAMITKDAYCRMALVRIGTKLSSDQ